MPVDASEFAAALGQYAAGVCLLTVRDGIDDVGTTVTSVMSVSAAPPLVAVGLSAGGYPAEVLAEVGRCGLTVLAAQHAIVASRFSSAGRPSARHLLESVPWTRAPGSDAIVLSEGAAALDCRLERLIETGDHVLALLGVEDLPVLNPAAAPLLRLRGRYVDESGRPFVRP
ncbi:MAG: Flavin-dependent reductase [Blastococcus sp.]|jgi:flavin reductase (DIM6/NTAB) family NADH-FMN oxidoreductase RutF|nr:Flavin-dependent reductase [Blastococcus sp.]